MFTKEFLGKTVLNTTFIALTLLPCSASAATINTEGAEHLKTIIQSYIDDQKQLSAASGATLQTEGQLEVTPKETYYHVTTPDLKTIYPGNITYNMGKIALNVMPGNTDTEWKFAVSLPPTIEMTAANGETMWKAHLGTQKASGVWNTELNYTTKLNATYQNILLDAGSKNIIKTKIDTLGITQSFKVNPSTKKWSGPMSLTASGISSGENTNQTFHMDEASVIYQLTDFDAENMIKIRERVKEIGQSATKSQDKEKASEPSLQILEIFQTAFDAPMGEVTSDLSFKNLSFNKQDASDPISFSVESGHMGFKVKQDMPKKADIGINFGASGIKTQSNEYSHYIPQTIDHNITIKNFPISELITMGQHQAAIEMGENSTNENQVTPELFPEILAKAATTIEHALKIESAAYKINGTGNASATQESPLGFTASQTLQIDGLDSLISEINSIAKERPEIRKITAPLTMFQMMGQQNADTPTIRSYNLVVEKDGRITMNGSDLSSMIGGLGNNAPAQ